VPADRVDDPEPGADVVVAGGPTRSASVRAGLAAVPADAEVVLVHDAARPLASSRLWERVIEHVELGNDAVVPAVPVNDTLREVGGRTVDRTRFVAVQTPQGFAAGWLRQAHENDPEGTDDASLVEGEGGNVLVVEGEAENVKVTSPHDLAAMQALFP
jgi:2-C-methyl-D-erythritol 4-phosphate cytidylyltransferase